MRRLSASASLFGLGLMSAPGVLLCGSSAVGLEARIALFLSGALLFVAGGSGYAMATPAASAVPIATGVSELPSTGERRRRVGR
jgi:hypothetical protein